MTMSLFLRLTWYFSGWVTVFSTCLQLFSDWPNDLAVHWLTHEYMFLWLTELLTGGVTVLPQVAVFFSLTHWLNVPVSQSSVPDLWPIIPQQLSNWLTDLVYSCLSNWRFWLSSSVTVLAVYLTDLMTLQFSTCLPVRLKNSAVEWLTQRLWLFLPSPSSWVLKSAQELKLKVKILYQSPISPQKWSV